ncbi:MAG TPA: hypothetical protein VIM11_15465 [Tepidisphaeraceae bacterium]
MIHTIVLDSGPLALIVHQRPLPVAQECRDWALRHVGNGQRILVPAIVAYELRRELLRLNHIRSLRLLDSFLAGAPDRYLLLTDADLVRAADMWASIRRIGRPTSDQHALDVDVILAAQSLSLGLAHNEFIIATTNVAHLNRLAPVDDWRNI